ncbi:Uncharacterized protein SCF082_LOCUS47603 [Durusdinium trenchii]|uniref:Uncharacterized protein n=1 Tax=Durusdinium trenchii TaxID=1381693 RepID=A0ABP0RNY4_9DINO
MTRAQKEQVRRIISPKPTTGRLEVPEDITTLWNTEKGKAKLFSLWCKSGGVKAVFIERVEILSITTKTKTLEVKGGFYTIEDMKNELKYSQERIDKIVKWAVANKLTRKCEYDESTYEYWVNTRTEGSLKREDVERLSRKREFEQEADAQDCMPSMDFSVGGFMDDLGTPGDLQLEGQRPLELSDSVKHIAKNYSRGVPAIDCIEEATAASKCDPCPVLNRIASIRINDADTPLFKTLLKCGQALDIPIHNLKLGDNDFTYPVLLPKDVLSSIAKRGYIQKRPRGMEAAAMGEDEVAMGINLLGNSLGNRFLFAALHNNYIKNDKSIFYDLMDAWGKNMHALFNDGLMCSGRTFRFAVLGMVGDAPFIRDAGLMNRSFNNIRKSARAETLLPGVCHLCAAGKTHGPPYEHLDILSAQWVSTTGIHNFLPWNEPPPLLAHIAAEQQNLANFFKGDLFHIWYSGLGKDFCGSSLVFMLKGVMKKKSKSESMSFLNEELRRWQHISKSSVHFGKFTWDLLDYDGPRNYPKGKWSKGMDTGKVTKFIEFLLSEILVENQGGVDRPMLVLIQDACKSIGAFLRTLFKAGFFLTGDEAHQAISAGNAFLLSYEKLAKMAFSLKKALYKLKPKAHAFAHLVLEMLTQHRHDRTSVLNCVAFSTFMCEDFVGHVARLSRRVSPKVQGRKVIFRYLVALQRALLQET